MSEAALRLVRMRLWTDDEWFDRSRFECDELRCSVPGGPWVVTGTDLPGSWHQQLNGGERRWCSVHGEIESK